MGYPRVVARAGSDGELVVEEVSGEALRAQYDSVYSASPSPLNARKRRRVEKGDEEDGDMGEEVQASGPEMESNTENQSRAGSPCRTDSASD